MFSFDKRALNLNIFNQVNIKGKIRKTTALG